MLINTPRHNGRLKGISENNNWAQDMLFFMSMFYLLLYIIK